MWNINLYNIQCSCESIHNDSNDYGWDTSIAFRLYPSLVNGTSILLDKCWAKDCGIGYSIRNINYSTMNCCAADNISERSYVMQDSSITMNGCGTENVRCNIAYSGILHFYSSIITLNNFTAYNVGVSGTSSVIMVGGAGKVVMTCCRFHNYLSGYNIGYNVNIKESSIVIIVNPLSITSNGTLGDSVEEGSTLSIDYGNRIVTRNINNALYNYIRKDYWNIGTTSQRPSLTIKGFQYFDTDLKKPIWYNGEKWVDAIGTEV